MSNAMYAIGIDLPQVIALLSGLGVFAAIVFIAVIHDEFANKKSRTPRPSNEWLFTRWDEKIYDTFIKKEPEVILRQMGVKVEEYYKDCEIIRKEQKNLKKMAADKIIGVFVSLFSLLFILVAGLRGAFITIILFMVGMALYQGDNKKAERLAKEKRAAILRELPRFLDLLQTALYINMPISEAIIVTAQHLKGTIIAEELLESMAESHMGATSWQSALQEMAFKYDVDAFADFVQYLITGYEKGLSIYDVVSRQADEVRDYALINAEEAANKMTNAILVPIAIYKLMPIILIAAYPLVIQMTKGAIF